MDTALQTRIDLPLLDYSKRRNSKVTECYLVLGDTHVEYKIVGSYESLNEDTDVWEYKIANYRWCRPRKNMSEVNMYLDNPENLYSVGIDFNGIADGNNWLFKSGKAALVVYNQLRQYMVS